jgi:hypothetical protein
LSLTYVYIVEIKQLYDHNCGKIIFWDATVLNKYKLTHYSTVATYFYSQIKSTPILVLSKHLLWIMTSKRTTAREDRDFIEKVHRYASVRNKNVDLLVNKMNRYKFRKQLYDHNCGKIIFWDATVLNKYKPTHYSTVATYFYSQIKSTPILVLSKHTKQPGTIGISLKRYTDTLRYEIKTLTFWLTRSTAIVDQFACLK